MENNISFRYVVCEYDVSEDYGVIYQDVIEIGKNIEFHKEVSKWNNATTYCIACSHNQKDSNYYYDSITNLTHHRSSDCRDPILRGIKRIDSEGNEITTPFSFSLSELRKSVDDSSSTIKFIVFKDNPDQKYSLIEALAIIDRSDPDQLANHLDNIGREDWINIAISLDKVISKMKQIAHERASSTEDALSRVNNIEL